MKSILNKPKIITANAEIDATSCVYRDVIANVNVISEIDYTEATT